MTPTPRTEATPYKINGKGEVFSYSGWRGKKEIKLHQPIHPDGYKRVRLMENGKRKSWKVHILVAREFLGPKPSNAHEIRHLDGNPLNNHFENLKWGTQKENADDREKHGRTSRGRKHSEAIKRGLANVR